MHGRFAQIVMIGCGKIAGDVLQYVVELRNAYGYSVCCIEHEVHEFSRLKMLCEKWEVTYQQITDKCLLAKTFQEYEEPSLLISAGNYYIFPSEIIRKKNLEIINFHNALLPKYPGRNAPTWAIYFGETVSGATWHYVTEHIDDGEILAQKEVPLTEDIKAYELTGEIMQAALEGFREFYEPLLQKKILGHKGPQSPVERKIYYSYEIPGNGKFSLDMPVQEIYRLLRAMDYGKSAIFPPATFRLENGETAEVLRYGRKERRYSSLAERIITVSEECSLYIWISEKEELRIKYKVISKTKENESWKKKSKKFWKKSMKKYCLIREKIW